MKTHTNTHTKPQNKHTRKTKNKHTKTTQTHTSKQNTTHTHQNTTQTKLISIQYHSGLNLPPNSDFE